MADGFAGVMLQSQREIEGGKRPSETLLADELRRSEARPQLSPAEEARPTYKKMLGWIERIDPSRLTHVRVTPRFERGAGLGSTLAKRECDRRIEILVNPAVWEAILRLDGLDRLDASGPTLAGLPVVDGDDPVLLAAL